MEMHQIRYFLAVARTLNFTRAAEDCNVAQPSLSRAVKKLEDELGGELFRRERDQTHLTELGRTMLPLLSQSYESALAAKAQAGSYRRADYAPLRIGLSQTVTLELIAPMLAELARAFPGLDMHFARGTAEAVLEALKAGELELAIAADAPVDWDRFDRWALFEEGYVLVAAPGHAIAGRKQLDLAEIAGETLIARPFCESNARLDAALEGRNLALRHRHESASEADALALAGRGLGLCLLPASTGRAAAVPAVPVADPDIGRTVQAFAVAGRQRSLAAAALLRLLRAADWAGPEASTA